MRGFVGDVGQSLAWMTWVAWVRKENDMRKCLAI